MAIGRQFWGLVGRLIAFLSLVIWLGLGPLWWKLLRMWRGEGKGVGEGEGGGMGGRRIIKKKKRKVCCKQGTCINAAGGGRGLNRIKLNLPGVIIHEVWAGSG